MKKVDNEYLSKLYGQYCDAIGKNNYDFYEMDDAGSFMEWVLCNKSRVELYRNYLEHLNVDMSNAIELGKGNLDTLGIENAKIVSPHAHTLGLENSQICFTGGMGFVVKKEMEIIQDEKIFDHNPFDLKRIEDWPKIVTSTGVDISVGVYGDKYDEDYKNKLKLIMFMREKLGEDYVLDYDTIGSNYFATVNSNEQKRVKVKVLSRVK